MHAPRSPSRRRVLRQACAGAAALGLSPLAFAAAGAGAKTLPETDIALPTGDVRDFDFFVGHWTFRNRRLKQRWVGSDDWDEFPASLRCESRMGGVVNLDEGAFPTKGWQGMTVRVFNLAEKRWYLYWINSSTGQLFPPVAGGFDGDRGVFYGDDSDEGRPVKVRFLWTRIDADHARWEQAFSRDGKAWETNWTMEHTRVGG
ncbi:Tat (twin-arginine translocation) pathway signal sequence domain protein [Lysobacter enzymogenes]|uniref:Tat (Twin-arginine translocation) pathway signal sequence domain protein n=1 Tax=Lysobacter enzymogenes TaxID=69 RepID=A0A0S2DN45_LYSEN|nr:hypothetical protein [Lysobacter enzymogenes]ALN59994.1 Tat (twin-arginine translocation) pathway signal sequence domain protein [Lysobacter enzymogenes]